jgi:hypothetical protein
MTDQLATRISVAIDAAASAVTAEEAMQHLERHAVEVEAPPPARHGRRWLGAAAAVAACAVGATAWVVLSPGSADLATSDEPQPVVTSAPFDVTSCRVAEGVAGCPMGVAEAERVLGISLPDPTGLPAGWEAVESRSAVRYWPSVGDQAPVAEYQQVWAPVGENLDRAGATPTYVQLRRRVALSGEPAATGTPLTLPNGQVAYQAGNTLAWTTDGVTSRLSGYQITDDDLRAIATSLP